MNHITIPYYQSMYIPNDDHSHGSFENALAHQRMMETIANEVCKHTIEEVLAQIEPKLEQMMQDKMYDAYEQALQDVLRVLEYDIESVTKIGIDGCRDIFEGKAAQKYISDQITKTIKKELSGKHLKM